MIPIANLQDKIKEITTPWSPIDVMKVNDQVIRLALFEGEYHWHSHTKEDELFYVFRGKIAIQLKGEPDVILCEGEMAIIPKNVEHCPKGLISSYVLMFEPLSLKSQGDR